MSQQRACRSRRQQLQLSRLSIHEAMLAGSPLTTRWRLLAVQDGRGRPLHRLLKHTDSTWLKLLCLPEALINRMAPGQVHPPN